MGRVQLNLTSCFGRLGWVLDQRLDRGKTAKLDPADSGAGTLLAESAGKWGVRGSNGANLRLQWPMRLGKNVPLMIMSLTVRPPHPQRHLDSSKVASTVLYLRGVMLLLTSSWPQRYFSAWLWQKKKTLKMTLATCDIEIGKAKEKQPCPLLYIATAGKSTNH